MENDHAQPEAVQQLRTAAVELAKASTGAKTPHLLTIEGCEYKVTSDGQARLQKPHWYHAPKASRMPGPVKAPRASADRSLETWSVRVGALITKAGDDNTTDYHGRGCGEGYYIVTTDGHRALCHRGEPTHTGAPIKLMTEVPSTACWFAATPELIVALKRMGAVSGSTGTTTLTVSRSRQRLILSTRDRDTGTVAQEWVPIAGALQPVAVSVRTDFLLSSLGAPGLRVGLNTSIRVPVVIESADAVHRLLIMPVRDGAVTPVADLDRPRVAPAPSLVSVSRSRVKAPPASVPVARLSGADANLTPAQKAWRTRKAKIDAGIATPTDWVAAGKKAWETRMARLKGAA